MGESVDCLSSCFPEGAAKHGAENGADGAENGAENGAEGCQDPAKSNPYVAFDEMATAAAKPKQMPVAVKPVTVPARTDIVPPPQPKVVLPPPRPWRHPAASLSGPIKIIQPEVFPISIPMPSRSTGEDPHEDSTDSTDESPSKRMRV